MSSSKLPRKIQDAAFRPIDDQGGLVVLPGRSEVKVLNPVGIKIFGMLDGEHTEDQAVAAILEEFDVTEAQAREDVQAFVRELDEHGMLADTEPATGV